MLRFDDEPCKPVSSCFLLSERRRSDNAPIMIDFDDAPPFQREPYGGTGPTMPSSTTVRRPCRTRSARSIRGSSTVNASPASTRLVRVGALAAAAVLPSPSPWPFARKAGATCAPPRRPSPRRSQSCRPRRSPSRRLPLSPRRRRWTSKRPRTTTRSPPSPRWSPRPSRRRAPARHRRLQRLLEPLPASSGATVEEWLAANGSSPDTPLYVGDELCIPEGATAPAPAPTTTAAPATTAPPETAAAPQTTSAPPTPAPTPVVAPVVTTAPPTTPATSPPGPARVLRRSRQ